MDDLADCDRLRLDEPVHHAVQGGGIEWIDGLELDSKPAQQLGSRGRANPLIERLVVVRKHLVPLKQLGVIQDVAGDLDPIARGLDDVGEPVEIGWP